MEPTTDNGLRARDLDRRESGNLIGSDKVEGTAVYSPGDEKIGTIERVMIDKPSGGRICGPELWRLSGHRR